MKKLNKFRTNPKQEKTNEKGNKNRQFLAFKKEELPIC